MKFKTLRRLILQDRNGRVVKDTGFVPSHSYVIQWLEAIWALAEAIGIGSQFLATDITGVESNILRTGSVSNILQLDAGVGGLYGIVVGTNAGASPEDNEDYALDTLINHSAVGAAGCLNYRAVTFTPPAVSGPNVDFDISRPYINETGSTITVKETGIYCYNLTDAKFHLLLRDVVPDFDVDDGYTLTAVYRLRTTV